jgi:hypothetical protein
MNRRFEGAAGGVPAAGETVIVRPATVSVALRDAVPLFAAIEHETVPLPVREPFVMVIQLGAPM